MSLAGQIITPERDNAAIAAIQAQIDAINASLASSVSRGIVGFADQDGPVFFTSADPESVLFSMVTNVAASRQNLLIGSFRLQGKAGDTVIVRIRDRDSDEVLQGRKYTFLQDDVEEPMDMVRNLTGAKALSAGTHNLDATIEFLDGDGPAGIQGSSDVLSTLILMDAGSG